MINRDHIVENEKFVGLAGRGGILNFPISSRMEENYCDISPEIHRSISLIKNSLKIKYSSGSSYYYRLKPKLYGGIPISVWNNHNHNFLDVYKPVSNISGSALIESSYLLYSKAFEYSKNYQLHLPQVVNDFNADILKLEVVISSELKALFKEKDKWTSLFDFAEEYKTEFGISDEELWLEFGTELCAIQSEIEAIELYKKSIYVSKSYIERAKAILYNTSWETRSIPRCEIRHHIAFSTKNLDDEHNFGVKPSSRLCFTQSQNVFNEKNNYYKTFAFSQ